ncbi:MAG: hypothetical protein Q4A79_02500 [Candidatus Saccharibacteria bacterium]|nr:hypothetical protein [Candidatus Saccharibacteria bacterium]
MKMTRLRDKIRGGIVIAVMVTVAIAGVLTTCLGDKEALAVPTPPEGAETDTGIGGEVFASSNGGSLQTVKIKAVYEGVYDCFARGFYKTEWLANTGGLGFVPGASSYDSDSMISDLSSIQIGLPYGLTDASDNNVNCREVMAGFSSNNRSDDQLNKGLIPDSIKESYNGLEVSIWYGGDGNGNTDMIGSGLAAYGGVGYRRQVSNSNATEVSTRRLQYRLDPESHCRSADDGQLTTCAMMVRKNTGEEEWITSINFPMVASTEEFRYLLEGSNVPDPGSRATYIYEVTGGLSFAIQDIGSSSEMRYEMWDFNSSFRSQVLIASYADVLRPGNNFPGNITISNFVSGDDAPNSGSYVLLTSSVTEGETTVTGLEDALMVLVGSMEFIKGINEKNLINYKLNNLGSYYALRLSDQEIYELYKYYVQNVFGATVVCPSDSNYHLYQDYPDIKWLEGGETCKIDTYDTVSDATNVYGVKDDKHFGKPNITLEDIVATMNGLNFAAISMGGSDANSPVDSEGESESGFSEACRRAAGALGFVICPMISGASEMLMGGYTGMILPNLKIEPTLIGGTGGLAESAVYQSWLKISEFANAILGGMLVFSIGAQFSKFEIDKFGIQKMAPQIIMRGIAGNLSFIGAVGLVDLSNILGAGIGNIFNDLSNSLPAVDVGTSIGSEAGRGLLAAALLVVGAYALFANLGVIISVLLGLLSALGSMLFLWVVLAIGKSAVVVVSVTSYLIIIAGMIPAAKTLVSKVYKLIEGVLALNPVVNILTGAGSYVQRLILVAGGNNIFMMITAMIAGFAPIWLIPAMIKGSISTLGNLSGKVMDFGRKTGGWLSGVAKDSDLGQRATVGLQKSSIGLMTAASKVPGVGRFVSKGAINKRIEGYRATRKGILAGDRINDMSVIEEGLRKGADEAAIEERKYKINSATNSGTDQAKLFRLFEEAVGNGDTIGARAITQVIAGAKKPIRKAFLSKYVSGYKEPGFEEFSKKAEGNPRTYESVLREISDKKVKASFGDANAFATDYAESFINEGKQVSNLATEYGNWKDSGGMIGTMSSFSHPSDFKDIGGGQMKEIRDFVGDPNRKFSDSDMKTMVTFMRNARLALAKEQNGLDTEQTDTLNEIIANIQKKDGQSNAQGEREGNGESRGSGGHEEFYGGSGFGGTDPMFA